MHDMTAGNLRSAFGGESMAHMRYLIWGHKAEEEGLPNIARLFRAVAHAETVHATNHFKELRDEASAFLVPSMAGFGLGATSENLEGAIEGETFEVNEMYPAYAGNGQVPGREGGAAELSLRAVGGEDPRRDVRAGEAGRGQGQGRGPWTSADMRGLWLHG